MIKHNASFIQKNNHDYRHVHGIDKYWGLMFRRRSCMPLLFTFKEPTYRPLHSWFVFFPFEVIWYDATGTIIERRVVRPFQSGITPSGPYTSFVEIPL